MTDREMLELAAKAAGISGSWFEDCNHMIRELVFDRRFGIKTKAGLWNPITDDGDALRLADHLDLIVDFSRFAAIQADRFYLGHRDFDLGNNVNEAITRAAAQIGKDMK